MGCQGGGSNLDKRTCCKVRVAKAWVGLAKGGSENFDKRNVVLELESLKAWVGLPREARVCCQVGSQRNGLPRGGKC